MNREDVLDQAKALICGDRQRTYGDAPVMFGAIAKAWTAYLAVRWQREYELSGADVAAMMGVLKALRSAANPAHADSWVDMAGYAALGGELVGGKDGKDN